jgi:enamine deaminase RidA (YjgF/YER057c/UK114 family)
MAGYARAVRIGDTVHVSGTTATDREGALVGVGDPEAQTAQIVRNIAWALGQLGSGLEDVVRTRIYVHRREHWERVARAHGDAFAAIRPATTLVIAGLIDPDMLVEIEAKAIVGSGTDAGA